jgi:hypothetical protein
VVVDPGALGPSQGEEALGRVHADHLHAPGGQPVGDAPVPAGRVEHQVTLVQVREAHDGVGVALALLLVDPALIEVQVVVAEDLVEVEAHGREHPIGPRPLARN